MRAHINNNNTTEKTERKSNSNPLALLPENAHILSLEFHWQTNNRIEREQHTQKKINKEGIYGLIRRNIQE